MKNHLLSALAISLFTGYYSLITCGTALAQVPQGIPYQAIARNASGTAIANTAVKVRFSIRDSIATGPVRYQETHSPTTSALGLFSVNVGMGTVVSGTFSGINWGKNAKFLQVELDPAGGTSYTDLGTTQMMSVPYALQANAIKMRTSATGDTLYTGGGNYVIIPGISAANPSTGNPNWNGTTLTDIDGNTYQTVTIGNQIWMKENLKVSKYRNGDPITTSLTTSNWINATMGAYAVYGNDPANDNAYGKLYNWYVVGDARGLCPAGWHVPSNSEYSTLVNYLGGSSMASGKLKAISYLWNSPNTGATNESGFSALPAGGLRHDGNFDAIGLVINLWSSTEEQSAARCLALGYDRVNSDNPAWLKTSGCSVRCIKD